MNIGGNGPNTQNEVCFLLTHAMTCCALSAWCLATPGHVQQLRRHARLLVRYSQHGQPPRRRRHRKSNPWGYGGQRRSTHWLRQYRAHLLRRRRVLPCRIREFYFNKTMFCSRHRAGFYKPAKTCSIDWPTPPVILSPRMQECISLAETLCTVECVTWGLMSDAANQESRSPGLPSPHSLHALTSPFTNARSRPSGRAVSPAPTPTTAAASSASRSGRLIRPRTKEVIEGARAEVKEGEWH
jgi:hypothetical protein